MKVVPGTRPTAGMRSFRARVRPPAWALLAAGLSSCGGTDSGSRDGSLQQVPAPDAGDVPSRIVRLVNPRAYPVVILGSAGAGEVLLDTLGAGDSALVDVRVGSELLKLRALDLEGHELGRGFLELGDPSSRIDQDSMTSLRWVLPRSR